MREVTGYALPDPQAALTGSQNTTNWFAQRRNWAGVVIRRSRRRLRPILMTALATIFGMLPVAVGVGSGAQLLQPLAIAVIGGVTVSMVLSLLVTPVLFYVLRQRGL